MRKTGTIVSPTRCVRERDHTETRQRHDVEELTAKQKYSQKQSREYNTTTAGRRAGRQPVINVRTHTERNQHEEGEAHTEKTQPTRRWQVDECSKPASGKKRMRVPQNGRDRGTDAPQTVTPRRGKHTRLTTHNVRLEDTQR